MLEEDSSTPYKILSVTWGQWPSLSSPSSDKALPLLLTFRICSSLLHGFQKSKSVHLCVASHSASHKSREVPTALVIPNQLTLTSLSEHTSYFRDIWMASVVRLPQQCTLPGSSSCWTISSTSCIPCALLLQDSRHLCV